MKKTMQLFFVLCFLLSGAAGLIYEIVWSRQLTLFVGITTYAHTAVITAYMLGLALGSLVIGRLSDRHTSPLRLFAWLEIAVGAYAAATPWLYSWLQMLYAQTAGVVGVTGPVSHLVRFAFALIMLLPATFLMGGTLPVMIRGMTQRLPDLAVSCGRWYGINTLGAVIGTVAAGYLFLPLIGLRNTLFVGVVLDLVVAVLVLSVCGKHTANHQTNKHDALPYEAEKSTSGLRGILFLFALSGFSALAYQVAWIRSLTLVLGSSVYSFTTTLAAFLVGIGLGSLLYRRMPGGKDREGRLRQAAVITWLTGFCSLFGLLLIGRLPYVFVWGFQHGWGLHFVLLQLFMFTLCFAVMIVPTFLLGTLFPLMAALWSRDDTSIGRDVGVVYAANTAGCIFGTLMAGLLFLPHLGVHGTIIVAAGLHLLVGAGFQWTGASGRKEIARTVVVSCLLMIIFAVSAAKIPAWDRKVMTSGVFNYAARALDTTIEDFFQDRKRARDILYYEDGRDGTVTVLEDKHQRLLVINGKIDATSVHDLPTQAMLGQIPMLIHPDPKSVLIIGLGSGITAGSVALNDEVERIDILEISPEVVKASAYFTNVNHNILNDPRVHLIVADARNYLLATETAYDVIISQPSNPWISGIANLFTRDFFELLESRLAPGGIATQWFHIYNMSPDDTRSVMCSYQDVFPHVSVWQSMNSDLIMIGSKQPHRLDASRLNEADANPGLREQLIKVNKAGLWDVARMFLLNDLSLASYCEGATFNSDDRPQVEFHAPRNLYSGTTEKTLDGIFNHLDAQPADFPVSHLSYRVEDGVVLPGFDLKVLSGSADADDQWSEDYNVWREYYETGADAPDLVGIGCGGEFEWVDQETKNRMEIYHAKTEPALEQLAAFLQSRVSATPLAGGEVDLPGGRRGVWVLTADVGSSIMKYTITWSAKSSIDGHYVHFVAEREQPYSEEGTWGSALIEFAKVFVPDE